MIEFQINEKNKALYDKNFIKVVGDQNTLTSEGNDTYGIAEPLNNDPEIQEYGGITDILKNGYLNKDYKIFKIDSPEPICFVSKEPLKIFDTIALINGWEEFNNFVVFMGTTENNTKYLFKYLHDDTIRNYTPKIKYQIISHDKKVSLEKSERETIFKISK